MYGMSAGENSIQSWTRDDIGVTPSLEALLLETRLSLRCCHWWGLAANGGGGSMVVVVAVLVVACVWHVVLLCSGVGPIRLAEGGEAQVNDPIRRAEGVVARDDVPIRSRKRWWAVSLEALCPYL